MKTQSAAVRRWTSALGLALLALATFSTGARADAAADKVLDCMRANLPPTLRVQDIRLTAVDRAGGKRELRGQLFAMRDQQLLKAMLRLSAPTDLSGAAYLVLERTDRDDMFLYLPSVGRVRRINSSGSDGSLMGTDFSYADVKQLQNVFSGGAITRGKDETLQGRTVYRLSMTPARASDGSSSEYSRVEGWIDQQSCVSLRAELYAGKTVRKRLEAPATSIRKSGQYSYVSEATMTDLQAGTSTKLEVLNLSSGDALSGRYFDPHTFYLGN